MDHGIARRLGLIGTRQGKLHFRQVFVVVLRDDCPGLHLRPDAVALAREHLDYDVLRNLVHGIVDGLHLDVDGTGSPRHAHPVCNTDVVRLVVGRAADRKINLNFCTSIVSTQGHPGRSTALGCLRVSIQRQFQDRHRILNQDRSGILGVTVVKSAVGDMNHHEFIPFSLRILLGSDTNPS